MTDKDKEVERLRREVDALNRRIVALEWQPLMKASRPKQDYVYLPAYYQWVYRNTTGGNIKYG